jgi:mannosyltransferase
MEAVENIIKDNIILLIIFLTGIFLRLYEIARKPLWLDEASTYFLTNQPDIQSVWVAASNDHHAPLHFITVWLIKFIGTSEFWLRFPSAIAGALTIIFIFLIVKELIDKNTGIIAAALLAVSPYHIMYSQEARMYGMVVLFVAAATYMLIRASRTKSRNDWILFGIACALAFYTHFYASFAILSLIIGYVIIRSKDIQLKKLPDDAKYFTVGLIISAILVSPLISSFINQSGFFVSHTFNWGLSMWNIPSQALLMFSYYSEPIALIFIMCLAAGTWVLFNRDKYVAAALVAAMAIPMIISLYLSQIIPFNIRYLMYIMVIFLAVISIPISWLGQKIHKKHGYIIMAALIILISMIPVSAYYTNPIQEDWRVISAHIERITRPGDAIAPLPYYMIQPLSYYYNNKTDGTHYINFALDEQGFQSINNTPNSVYFVATWDLQAADPSGYSADYLSKNSAPAVSVPGIYVFIKK